MNDKREQLARSASNPFIDPQLCRRHIEAKRERLEEEVERQRSRAGDG
jgi:hypothetical protein